MSGFLKNHGHSPVAVGGVEDHVHLLFGLARTESIAKVTGELKVSTGKWLQPRCAEFRWQAGYGAFSVGNAELEVVRRYVQDQENHHRKVSFQDEYRSLLVECGIEFDERYMWD
jgi:REP element-mobilizing transposase RayT